ncbi:MAG: histidinol phosphate phosphatase [Bacteroidia bacterium]|nr:MAG: histidinol phosphate phosphatase [Bacteroidia bacterium]
MKKAVFLDRDGTLNSDKGHYYIYRPEDFVLNEGVVEGLKLLQENGFLLVVVTNQGGVAKGVYTEKEVEKVHQKMCALLEKEGVNLTAIYYCPHHDSVATCNCRKPKSGMLEKAIEEYDLEVTKCYMIGDSERDMEAAARVGIKAFKIAKNTSIIEVCKQIIQNED